ncbi:MAG: branched-chain amino acid ABC transporter substrate-binding protein [Deltaproteobacteria bacterium]|nr:branched-chain amino acid ABC transporter substrate-binding protein [Deltaproteobacteria bacterium]
MKKLHLLLIILLFAHPVWAVEPIKIGFIGPLTGDYMAEGMEARQVVELLAQNTNDHGGILGKKIEMIYEDDQGNPQTAGAAAKRLVQQRVIAVIGSYTSAVTEATQQVFHQNRIMQITYGATAVPLTERGLGRFFRICPRDDNQAKAAVRVMQKMKMKRIAIVHDGSLYGKGLAETIKEFLDDSKAAPVFYDALIPGKGDYSDILAKAKDTRPDFVFFAGFYPEAAQLLKGRQQMDWHEVIFMGGDAVDSSRLTEISGVKAAEGFYFLSMPRVKDIDAPRTRQFINSYEKAYKSRPASAYALLAGDAFAAITESVKRLKTTDSKLLSEYLHTKYNKKDGLTGNIRFDLKGDVVNDLHAVYRVDNQGRYILQRKLQYGIFTK